MRFGLSQILMKISTNASNNKEVYLSAHHDLKTRVTNMSEWLEEAGTELSTAASDELSMQSKHDPNSRHGNGIRRKPIEYAGNLLAISDS